MYLALTRSLNLAMVDLGRTVGLQAVQAQFTELTGRRPKNPTLRSSWVRRLCRQCKHLSCTGILPAAVSFPAQGGDRGPQ